MNTEQPPVRSLPELALTVKQCRLAGMRYRLQEPVAAGSFAEASRVRLEAEAGLLALEIAEDECIATAAGAEDLLSKHVRLGVSVAANGDITVIALQSDTRLILAPSDVPLLIGALQNLHQIESPPGTASLDPSP